MLGTGPAPEAGTRFWALRDPVQGVLDAEWQQASVFRVAGSPEPESPGVSRKAPQVTPQRDNQGGTRPSSQGLDSTAGLEGSPGYKPGCALADGPIRVAGRSPLARERSLWEVPQDEKGAHRRPGAHAAPGSV